MCDKFNGVKELKIGSKQRIGSYAVQVFNLEHNVPCIGFLIENKDMGRLLFITDTNSVPYKFKDISHILCEANYSEDVMVDNYCDNKFSSSASENHLSIEQALEFVRLNYSPSLQTVVALHLSNQNSDENLFKKKFKDELGINLIIADAGVILELNKEEF